MIGLSNLVVPSHPFPERCLVGFSSFSAWVAEFLLTSVQRLAGDLNTDSPVGRNLGAIYFTIFNHLPGF